jgi:hypothetical protein
MRRLYRGSWTSAPACSKRFIEPFFPRFRGLARVDDRKPISGIIYVIRHGMAATRRGGWGSLERTVRSLIGRSIVLRH